MAKLNAIVQQPKDAAAFDDHFLNKHVPLAKQIPGLLGYEVTQGDVMGMAGTHAVYLVATLEFESMPRSVRPCRRHNVRRRQLTS